MLGNVGRHLMKYKFSYGVKGFLGYLVYSSMADWCHYNKRMFLTYPQHAQFATKFVGSSVVFGGVCLLM